MASRLVTQLAAHVAQNPRLAGVPIPVVEEVIGHAVGHLAEIVPMATLASEVDAIDFEFCEQCGHLIDPAEPEGAVHDVEGIWLCNACSVEEVASP